jgi:hypothetical protein
LKAKPVADSISINGSRARSAGQSCFRCSFANGHNIRKAPIQRTQDSVIGGMWPAT